MNGIVLNITVSSVFLMIFGLTAMNLVICAIFFVLALIRFAVFGKKSVAPKKEAPKIATYLK